MRNYPEDREEVERIKAEPWQLELLKLNPAYCSWGPYEDYMIGGKESGWMAPVIVPTWAECSFGLDELNEVVNFYFEVSRESHERETCDGSGYHPDAQWISESWYGHSTPFRAQTVSERRAKAVMASFGVGEQHSAVEHAGFPSRQVLAKYGPEFRAFCEEMAIHSSWSERINEAELQALFDHGRLGKEKPSLESVNNQRGLCHDAINRSICIRARCAQLGVPLDCEACDGRGREYIEPAAHVGLVLWVLHPRKGCSRGVEIKRIEKHEMPLVFAYLRAAAARNAERFSRIPS